MKVLITGISCSGWKEHTKDAVQETNIQFLSVGDIILRVSQERGFGFTDDQILNAPESALRVIRSLASSEIKEQLDDRAAIIGCHATFRWKTNLLMGFDPHILNDLNVDMYVNVMDDLPDILTGLAHNTKWCGQDLTADDVLSWREEEYLVTQMLAERADKHFYLMLRKDDPTNLKNLILSPGKRKAYISFPITNIDRPEELERVERFRDQLRQWLIVFDPLAMKENDAQAWPADRLPEFGDKIRRRIANQTVVRDYQLIRQSDIVIVYIHEDHFSAGVVNEIRTAHELGRKVYVVYPLRRSPFLMYYVDEVFSCTDQALEFLNRYYGNAQMEST
jgi:adenylate kinase